MNALAAEYPSREWVFRGQADDSWDLETSYQRYWHSAPLGERYHIENLLAQFRSGVQKQGLGVELHGNLNWLEYARHYGLATPLLDFTWSPSNALFFAFDGVRDRNKGAKAAIFALNLTQLAIVRTLPSQVQPSPEARAFLNVGHKKLASGLPWDELVFIKYPGVFTRRMHVQRGTFLYSTLNLATHGGSLLKYFSEIDEATKSEDTSAIIEKIIIPHKWVDKIFAYLDIIGIDGSTMYLSPEGVAKDVFNAFNYHPRAAYLRDEF